MLKKPRTINVIKTKQKNYVSATKKAKCSKSRIPRDIKNGIPDHSNVDSLVASCPRCLAAVAKANKPTRPTDGE